MTAKAMPKVERGAAGASAGPDPAPASATREPLDVASLFGRTMKRFPKTIARLAE